MMYILGMGCYTSWPHCKLEAGAFSQQKMYRTCAGVKGDGPRVGDKGKVGVRSQELEALSNVWHPLLRRQRGQPSPHLQALYRGRPLRSSHPTLCTIGHSQMHTPHLFTLLNMSVMSG